MNIEKLISKMLETQHYAAIFGIVLCFGASFILFAVGIAFDANSNKTTGTVIEMRQEKNSKGNLVLCPVVEYLDNTGKKRIYIGGGQAGYQKGDTVPIAYHRINKDMVRINDFSSTWLIPIVLFIAGIFAVVAFVVLAYVRKHIRAQSPGTPPASTTLG